ncbi:hypothetical protein U0070_020632, partial [Myodes glareolus]
QPGYSPRAKKALHNWAHQQAWKTRTTMPAARFFLIVLDQLQLVIPWIFIVIIQQVALLSRVICTRLRLHLNIHLKLRTAYVCLEWVQSTQSLCDNPSKNRLSSQEKSGFDDMESAILPDPWFFEGSSVLESQYRYFRSQESQCKGRKANIETKIWNSGSVCAEYGNGARGKLNSLIRVRQHDAVEDWAFPRPAATKEKSYENPLTILKIHSNLEKQHEETKPPNIKTRLPFTGEDGFGGCACLFDDDLLTVQALGCVAGLAAQQHPLQVSKRHCFYLKSLDLGEADLAVAHSVTKLRSSVTDKLSYNQNEETFHVDSKKNLNNCPYQVPTLTSFTTAHQRCRLDADGQTLQEKCCFYVNWLEIPQNHANQEVQIFVFSFITPINKLSRPSVVAYPESHQVLEGCLFKEEKCMDGPSRTVGLDTELFGHWTLHDLRQVLQKGLEALRNPPAEKDHTLGLWVAIPEDHKPPRSTEHAGRSGGHQGSSRAEVHMCAYRAAAEPGPRAPASLVQVNWQHLPIVGAQEEFGQLGKDDVENWTNQNVYSQDNSQQLPQDSIRTGNLAGCGDGKAGSEFKPAGPSAAANATAYEGEKTTRGSGAPAGETTSAALATMPTSRDAKGGRCSQSVVKCNFYYTVPRESEAPASLQQPANRGSMPSCCGQHRMNTGR